MLTGSRKKIILLFFSLLAILTTCFTFINVEQKSTLGSDVLTLKLERVSSWNDGVSEYLQVNGTVANNSSQPVSGWNVRIPLSTGSSLNQSWCGTYTIEQGTLVIVPDSSNSTIQANNSVTFGFILKNPGNFTVSDAVLNYNGKDVTPTISVPTTTPTPTPTAVPSPIIIITPTPRPTSPIPSVCTPKPTPVVTLTPIPTVTLVPTSTPIPTVTLVPTSTPTPKPTLPPGQSNQNDWLYTDGSRIFDKDGKEVWLTGVNWFGYNTGTNIFDGVWACNLDQTIAEIANRGFNLMRIPISSELILDWKSGTYPKPCYNDYVNPTLAGMNSLEIFDHVVAECKKNGIKIMMDIHCATNAAAHYYPVWFTPEVSEADYIASLTWLANRYKNDDTILAIDLKNEPHGKANDTIRAIWNNSTDPYNWKYVATKAAQAVLKENPNLLIVVEGIEIYPMDLKNNSDFHSTNAKEYYGTWWGGNLRGVKDFPIDLGQYQNKLVYSPHDYGPSVFMQEWFEGGYTMDSLYNDCWRDNWFYIQEQNIAPLLIGEWGGFMTEPNLTWMTYLRDFIIKNRIHHTFWCFNANSGDTGGLVLHDFTTWDEEKYTFLKKALWQKNGKFVGLDHDIPLGKNGISLSQY